MACWIYFYESLAFIGRYKATEIIGEGNLGIKTEGEREGPSVHLIQLCE